jgi:hypothetical protein
MIDTKELRVHAQQCATCKDPSCHCHLTLARQVPALLDELDATRARVEVLERVFESADAAERFVWGGESEPFLEGGKSTVLWVGEFHKRRDSLRAAINDAKQQETQP